MLNDEMRAAIEECAARKSAHVVDLMIRGTRGRAVIEVYIDAREVVTPELCSEVSRDVAELIDRSGWIQGSYRLDVSSPGIERPLKYPWQYGKHVGRLLSVTLRSAGGPEKKVGTLIAADDAGIVLDPGKGKPAETISFDDLEEVVVKAPW